MELLYKDEKKIERLSAFMDELLQARTVEKKRNFSKDITVIR